MQDDEYVIREVVLHDNGTPLVFARSVIPNACVKVSSWDWGISHWAKFYLMIPVLYVSHLA